MYGRLSLDRSLQSLEPLHFNLLIVDRLTCYYSDCPPPFSTVQTWRRAPWGGSNMLRYLEIWREQKSGSVPDALVCVKMFKVFEKQIETKFFRQNNSFRTYSIPSGCN